MLSLYGWGACMDVLLGVLVFAILGLALLTANLRFVRAAARTFFLDDCFEAVGFGSPAFHALNSLEAGTDLNTAQRTGLALLERFEGDWTNAPLAAKAEAISAERQIAEGGVLEEDFQKALPVPEAAAN